MIGFLKLEESIPALTSATSDPDPHVRRAAVSALAFSHLKPATRDPSPARSADGDWMVREIAAETLGTNVNGLQAADALIGAVADEYWQVRLKAVRSLGKLKVARGVAQIGGCIAHPQANLRKEAAAALGEIADPAGREISGAGGRRRRSRSPQERPLGAAAHRRQPQRQRRVTTDFFRTVVIPGRAQRPAASEPGIRRRPGQLTDRIAPTRRCGV